MLNWIEEGNSAVSTIEAIAHTAKSAGISSLDFDLLLLLFRVQKFRVFQNVRTGGKIPRVIAVSGVGKGAWDNIPGYESWHIFDYISWI